MWITKLRTCIYNSPSGYKVYQNFFYRWLTLGSNALQTVISRRNPEKPVLHYIAALTLMTRKYPDECCLLGLGGAGVAHIISAEAVPPHISAVDSSGEVIQIAQKFFMTDDIPNLTIIHQNASNFVQESPQIFSHILVDLYDANFFPPECNNELFFMNCKDRLKEDGFIAINLANSREQWPIFKKIKKHFKNTIVLPIKKSANIVIIASNHEHTDFFVMKLRESGEIQKIHLVESWGYLGEHVIL